MIIKKIISIISKLFTLFMMYLFFRYFIFIFILWAIIENLIKSVKNKKCNIFIKFLCNFVSSILISINYMINILLAVPANRILLQSSTTLFGSSRRSFTQTLRINIVADTIKVRGIMLYKILESIRKFGKNG